MSLSKRVLYDLTFTGGNAGNLNARSGTISNILSNVISTGNLNVSGNVNVSGTLTTVNITSTNIVDTNISAGNITVTNISSTTGTIGTVLSTNANITTGTVGTLSSTTGTIGTLLSTTGTIGTLSSTTGTIGTLIASSATVTNANITTQTTGTSIVTGNVGIGTTSPSDRLHMYNSSVNTNIGTIIQNGSRQYRIGIRGDTNNSFTIQDDTANTICMVINTAGNVGFGTSLPIYRLDIGGSLRATSGDITLGSLVTSTINVTTLTVGTSRITTNLLALGNSNTIANLFTNGGNVGVNTVSPGYNLDVNGSLATNTMLIRNATYSTTLASQVYDANTWYTAISPNVLALGIYIISLVFSAGGTPWNIYTSFINYVGYTSDNQSLYLSGANVPTTIHANNSNGIDYQVKVRGLYGPYGQSSGIQFSIAGTTSSGSWEVKAYRLI